MTRTVLVADDSPTIQRQASGLLIAEDIEVVCVCNGVAAIKKLPALKPHLILADVSMPGKDGYEVCAFVKATAELRHIPVLLTCSEFEPYQEDRGSEVRADGCVKKPFHRDELMAVVTKFLEQSEPARLAAAPASSLSATIEVVPSAEADAKAPEPETQHEFDLTALSEGVALTEPLEESTPGIPVENWQEDISGTNLQGPQPHDEIATPAVAENYPAGEKANAGVEGSSEVSANASQVESEEFRDPAPALSGMPTVFHASQESAGRSEDMAVPLPALEHSLEVPRPETADPSMPVPDLADPQLAYVPPGSTGKQVGIGGPEIVLNPNEPTPHPEAIPSVEGSREEPVPDTAPPGFGDEGPQFASISDADESKNITGLPQPPEPQASTAFQNTFPENEIEVEKEVPCETEEIEDRAAKAEPPDSEMIGTIVRKVVLRMLPPALGPEALEDVVRRITSELTAERRSQPS